MYILLRINKLYSALKIGWGVRWGLFDIQMKNIIFVG